MSSCNYLKGYSSILLGIPINLILYQYPAVPEGGETNAEIHSKLVQLQRSLIEFDSDTKVMNMLRFENCLS